MYSLVLLALAVANPQGVSPLTLTMEQAVDMAVASHPEVRASEAVHHAAKSTQKMRLGRMLPGVQVSDMQTWSHLNLHGMDAKLGGTAQSPSFLGPDSAANLLSVTAHQPLLGLFSKSQELQAASEQAHAARAGIIMARRDLALQVRRNYLALFAARALADTAKASERALLEQVDDAEHKMAAGSLASTDVLRPRAAAAAAKQKALAAQASEEIARTALLELLGLAEHNLDVNFLAPSTAAAMAAPVSDPMPLRATALAHRPEVSQAHHQARAAALQARAERLALLPSLDAQAGYMHVFAQVRGNAPTTTRAKADAYFVGLNASLPVWQWGANYYGQRAAYAQAAVAKERSRATARQIGAEVAQRHANYVACLGAVEAAQAETSSAEEAYRVMVATLAVDAATTSDLLQTEAAQTQARMNLVQARYDLAYAKIALDHALGQEG